MCLFESKLKNIKYLPNKKNNGIPPKLEDKRKEFITTNCGWCEECRKKIANDWRIRLEEEIKYDNNATFVTLSFSPENICKLEKDMYIKKFRGIENSNGEMLTDVNLLAAYAIRMWSERWRKYAKKAPKHWLITELGHTNSERIHLHGLIWGDYEMIEKTWRYGNIFLGKWVDESTINYIMKYVTKLDSDHKGYQQRIFTSKKLGYNYISTHKYYHRFREDKTKRFYKNKNGSESSLPRYYKEKLWTEEEREKLWGYMLDKNEIYLGNEKINTENYDVDKFNEKLEGMRHHNNIAGFGNSKSRNQIYYITEKMKVKSEEIKKIRNEKLVVKGDKRYIEKIIHIENDGISKSNNVDKIIYGNYCSDTLTEAQRDYNDLLNEARELGISVRVLRLKKAGII